MQLSCLPVSFFSDILEGRMTVGDWARLGSQVGLDAIDLSILFVPGRSPVQAETLRKEIEDIGMRVAMLTSYPDFTHPLAAQRQREDALALESVAIAAALGADYLRVTAGQAHPDTTREQGIAWASEGLERLVDSSRGMGVTLVYENHGKPGAWQYTDFSQPPDIFLEIVRRTAACGLQVNFDTGNAAAFAEDPLALLEAVIPRVATLHASDTAEHGTLKHVLLGTGATPFTAIFARLARFGWDGWICMEEASALGREGVSKAAAFVRATWQQATTSIVQA
jgi:sugar phosphate isomerase/epimerase